MIRKTATVLMVSCFATPAFAEEQITGIGSPYWTEAESITVAACVTTSTASSVCALFPAGSHRNHLRRTVVILSDAPGNCCWSGDGGLSFPASSFSMYDPNGPNGSNSCPGFRLAAAGQKEDTRPNRRLINSAKPGGERRGLCPNLWFNSGEFFYAPCDELDVAGNADTDIDCASFGGGSCVMVPTSEQEKLAGLFLVCVADADTVIFTARKGAVLAGTAGQP